MSAQLLPSRTEALEFQTQSAVILASAVVQAGTSWTDVTSAVNSHNAPMEDDPDSLQAQSQRDLLRDATADDCAMFWTEMLTALEPPYPASLPAQSAHACKILDFYRKKYIEELHAKLALYDAEVSALNTELVSGEMGLLADNENAMNPTAIRRKLRSAKASSEALAMVQLQPDASTLTEIGQMSGAKDTENKVGGNTSKAESVRTNAIDPDKLDEDIVLKALSPISSNEGSPNLNSHVDVTKVESRGLDQQATDTRLDVSNTGLGIDTDLETERPKTPTASKKRKLEERRGSGKSETPEQPAKRVRGRSDEAGRHSVVHSEEDTHEEEETKADGRQLSSENTGDPYASEDPDSPLADDDEVVVIPTINIMNNTPVTRNSRNKEISITSQGLSNRHLSQSRQDLVRLNLTPEPASPNSPMNVLTPPQQDAAKSFKRLALQLHGQIFAHRSAPIFANPITTKEAPGYQEIVYRPMDLKTLRTKIRDGSIVDTDMFQRDLLLMFANCVMFNGYGPLWDSVKDMLAEAEMIVHEHRRAELSAQ